METMFIVAASGVACLVLQNPVGWYVRGETAVGAVYIGVGGVQCSAGRTEAAVVAVSVPPFHWG